MDVVSILFVKCNLSIFFPFLFFIRRFSLYSVVLAELAGAIVIKPRAHSLIIYWQGRSNEWLKWSRIAMLVKSRIETRRWRRKENEIPV